MTLCTWVREFQTLIVGFLGFAGVIFTLWFNAWQTRRQRREERHHESETLRVALVEELGINRDWVVRETEKDERPLGNSTLGCAHGRYGRCLPQVHGSDWPAIIGEVRKVMCAYLSLQTFRASLLLIGVPPHTGARYVKVPGVDAV
jgi:hypothetical protein